MKQWALIGAAALLVAGCGGEEDLAASGAGAAQVEVLENLYDGRFELAWDDLHPAHQRIVPRARFVRCARQVITVADLESIEVLDVRDETIAIAGIPERKAKAVRVLVGSVSGDSLRFVNHQVKVGESWRWVLSSAAVGAYRKSRCP